jgi:hypothetical protein
MLHSFIYQMLPARVVFGRGTSAALPAEAERLGLRRLLVLSTPEPATYNSCSANVPPARSMAPRCTRRSM